MQTDGGVSIVNSDVHLERGDLIGGDKYVGLDETKVVALFRRMLDSLPPSPWAASSQAEPVLSRFLTEKTEGFVGRGFLFEACDRFCATHPRGYFIIRGEPGVGKTSFAAQLVRTRGLANHFNIRAESRSSPALFIENICGQLIRRHGLAIDRVPPDAGRDGAFLQYVLELVCAHLPEGERIAIVVDALDEADPTQAGVNPLHLPQSLPPRCFFIVTTRPHAALRSPPLRITCEQEPFSLDDHLAENQADIRTFLEELAGRDKIAAYCRGKGKSRQAFVDELAAASEGNFMYLRYVIPEIEAGRYKDTRDLPIGLRQYYEDHWALMRGAGGDQWYDTKVPVIAALTVAREPVSVALLSEFARVTNLARIHEVLREWAPFLEEQPGGDTGSSRYRIYHASFHEFLASMPEVSHLHAVEDRMTDCGLSGYVGSGSV